MAKAHKVLVAVPTAGGLHQMTAAIVAILARRSDVELAIVEGRPADYVRNTVVKTLLDSSGLSHVFFLDSDIEPPLDCLDRLLAVEAPLVTGAYPVLMPDGLRWALADKDADRRYRLLKRLESTTEPFLVHAGGAGCLLVRRDVFDKVKWPWFRWVEMPDGSQISEDIYFFRKCNEAGLRVTVEPQVLCNHYKTLNLTALMRNKMKLQQRAKP